jgi:flagellar motor protein MotB
MDRDDSSLQGATPAWAVFGDLMAGLLGAFVLILIGVLGMQLELASRLQAETERRQIEEQRRISEEQLRMAEQQRRLVEQGRRQIEERRREALERALAGPLAAGRITLDEGRIGISGSVLFELNADRLQPEGRQLLQSLVPLLADYLASHDEILMVSGFTDDQPVRETNRRFADNWELSAQRALTVTRALIAEGIPAASVFAAAFGEERPVASNADDAGRSRNRRVEIAPVPRAAADRG